MSEPTICIGDDGQSIVEGVSEINISTKMLINFERISDMQNLMELAMFSMLSFKPDLSDIEVHWDKLLLVQTGGYQKLHHDIEASPGEEENTFFLFLLLAAT